MKNQIIKVVRTLDANNPNDVEYFNKHCKDTFIFLHDESFQDLPYLNLLELEYANTVTHIPRLSHSGIFVQDNSLFVWSDGYKARYASILSITPAIGTVFHYKNRFEANRLGLIGRTVEYSDDSNALHWHKGKLLSMVDVVTRTKDSFFYIENNGSLLLCDFIRICEETLQEPEPVKEETIPEFISIPIFLKHGEAKKIIFNGNLYSKDE